MAKLSRHLSSTSAKLNQVIDVENGHESQRMFAELVFHETRRMDDDIWSACYVAPINQLYHFKSLQIRKNQERQQAQQNVHHSTLYSQPPPQLLQPPPNPSWLLLHNISTHLHNSSSLLHSSSRLLHSHIYNHLHDPPVLLHKPPHGPPQASQVPPQPSHFPPQPFQLPSHTSQHPQCLRLPMDPEPMKVHHYTSSLAQRPTPQHSQAHGNAPVWSHSPQPSSSAGPTRRPFSSPMTSTEQGHTSHLIRQAYDTASPYYSFLTPDPILNASASDLNMSALLSRLAGASTPMHKSPVEQQCDSDHITDSDE
ncbi:extensin-like [Thalassophryne amazonica]|uniref:extensin-like n=1 Tax=Thalassophryne amazonica TaxID=390379 RepID=UPI00147106B8|nr:extensin-like [Thalassophryne amazonica]